MIQTLKAWAFGAGLTVLIVGMALALRWLVWVAVAFLVVAFLLRFFIRRPSSEEP